RSYSLKKVFPNGSPDNRGRSSGTGLKCVSCKPHGRVRARLDVYSLCLIKGDVGIRTAIEVRRPRAQVRGAPAAGLSARTPSRILGRLEGEPACHSFRPPT